jgi:Pyruvate-formate lyase-activating enzyme
LSHQNLLAHLSVNNIIIENLRTAIEQDKEVILRIPVIPTINASLEDAEGFCKLLKSVGATKVNLLPFHQFGEKNMSF